MKTINKIILAGIGILIITAVMFIGLQGWNNFVVTNLGKISNFSLPLLLGFALFAGAVSFFAPCAIGLFPGYIAFYLGSQKSNEKTNSPAKLGTMAALGVLSFFIILSIIIFILGKGVTSYLKYVAPVIGFIILIFGAILFLGYSFKTSYIQKVFDKFKSQEKRNMYLFGAGYGAVSLGCTLPLLFALIIIPLTNGQIFNTFLSLIIYGFGMGILMMVATYMVAWSESNFINKMVRSGATIKKWSGIILMMVGIFLIWYNLNYSMI